MVEVVDWSSSGSGVGRSMPSDAIVYVYLGGPSLEDGMITFLYTQICWPTLPLPLPPLAAAVGVEVARAARRRAPLATGGLWRSASDWRRWRNGVTSAVAVELFHVSSTAATTTQLSMARPLTGRSARAL